MCDHETFKNQWQSNHSLLYLEPGRAGEGHVAGVAGELPVVLGQVALRVLPKLRRHRERLPAFCIVKIVACISQVQIRFSFGSHANDKIVV